MRVIAKPDGTFGDRLLMDKTSSFSLELLGDGRVRVVLNLSNGNSLTATGPNAIPAHQSPGGPDADNNHIWNHIAFTYGFNGTEKCAQTVCRRQSGGQENSRG